MDNKGCECKLLENNYNVRQHQWREICAKFYFEQDDEARRVLDYYEASKVDEISIATEEGSSGVDDQLNELVRMLGLQKCLVAGHHDIFSQTIQMLEVIKNDVRAKYHDHVSCQRYTEFNERAKASQGTNFELWTDDTGREQLSVRVQPDYLRSTEHHTTMMNRVQVFVQQQLPNVGCHPFLAGLYAALQWNLQSSTVVAWKLSDAVFVESGDSDFARNALALLVRALNFSHCESLATSSKSKASRDSRVKTREWHLDPFMSDDDIRQLLRLLPNAERLEGRPTGTKWATKMARVNVHGQRDETPTFFHRWCVVL